MSKRTVKDGEAMVIWSLGGKSRVIVGPMRIKTFFATVQFLDRVTAGPFEYLKVERRNGMIEHLRGPCSVWVNPVEHRAVTPLPAIHLTSPSDAIVVYHAAVGAVATREGGAAKEEDDAVPAKRLRRVVVRGPTVFVPNFGQRIHQFEWSKLGEEGEEVKKKDGEAPKTTFQPIRLQQPTVMEMALPLVTNDGADATITFAVAVAVTDLDRLLDGCEDLPFELRASLASDVLVLGRRLDSNGVRNLRGLAEILEAGQARPHDDGPGRSEEAAATSAFEDSLPVLSKRARHLGVEVRSVELRGCKPGADLAARWLAADDDAKAIRDAKSARRTAELRRSEAQAAHEAQVSAAARALHLDDLEAARRAAHAKRAHQADLDQAARSLELQDLAEQLNKADTEAQVRREQIRRAADHDLVKQQHDETVRFLANLATAAKVDTSDVLQLRSDKGKAGKDSVDAILNDKLAQLALSMALAPKT